MNIGLIILLSMVIPFVIGCFFVSKPKPHPEAIKFNALLYMHLKINKET